MASTSEGSQLEADGTTKEKFVGRSNLVEKRIGLLRHLFGPAYLVAGVALLVISTLLAWKIPEPFPQYVMTVDRSILKDLFDHTLSDYKAGLARLDTNLSAQALVVATAVLVIIRRSDSLNFFENSIPLSWLHAFIPILLIFLFMAYGYISHRLIASRMLGVQLACALSYQDAASGAVRLGGTVAFDNSRCGRDPNTSPHQELFRDASWIDGWFM
ncbi:hypothetical protein I6F35_37415 [Bradyrhizobium sp. BRP22]|uniref:hypothetical protein n=1 Tax=Bradyrhizobium sp. BRP22 TaxID=2793821 RepID=UPI001CD663C1|nr:hypothetical protein [Bradyrhizobium sp. BRP22]MCA1458780.1 hypothetical protein [Bradyrhizobium sp. BRP22]